MKQRLRVVEFLNYISNKLAHFCIIFIVLKKVFPYIFPSLYLFLSPS
jgi:hypothetical protein